MLLLMLALPAAPIPLPARAPMHFRIVTTSKTDIDLTAVGQPAMTVKLVSSAFVTITLTDSAAGKIAHVVIDSSGFDGGQFTASLPPAMSASARGAVFHAYIVNGKPIKPLLPDPAIMQAAQAVPGLELVLSGLRTAKPGDNWVDTTRADTTLTEGTSTGSRIATWKVTTADSTLLRAEPRLLQLDATWTGSTTVSAAGAGMETQLTGESHVTFVPGHLSTTATSTGGGSASMNMAGTNLPMKITTEVIATQLP